MGDTGASIKFTFIDEWSSVRSEYRAGILRDLTRLIYPMNGDPSPQMLAKTVDQELKRLWDIEDRRQ